MSAGSHSKGPTASKRHVLFAVLDWGLGHATRTWPLILAARQSGAQVTVASRGAAAVWLQHRMTEQVKRERVEGVEQGPPWVCLEKPGVHIRYAKGHLMLPLLALQLPRFLASIAAERRWFRALLTEMVFTHVVSDNCYGVYPHRCNIQSALITHQLAPPVPALLQRVAGVQIRRWTEAFGEVWIPDTARGELAGSLSGAASARHRFIGALSRFPLPAVATLDAVDQHEASPALVGIVSGPEPQRSLMETALLRCFARDGRSAVIFSGKPDGVAQTVDGVHIVPNADDSEIQHAMIHADCIVCRSGYSSLMDLTALALRAILVPTPGQPEQEYLAHHWQRTWGWHCVKQDRLAAFSPPKGVATAPHNLAKVTHGDWSWLHQWISS